MCKSQHKIETYISTADLIVYYFITLRLLYTMALSLSAGQAVKSVKIKLKSIIGVVF